MAGFIGRGSRAQRQPQRPGQIPGFGPGFGPAPTPDHGPGQGGPYPGPPAHRPGYGPQPVPDPGASRDNVAGHTRTFSMTDDPAYQQDQYPGQVPGQPGPTPWTPYQADGGPDRGYGGGDFGGGGYGDDANVSTYRAGQPSAPPAGPRLPWRPLLSGIVLHPNRTFYRMRDYQVWGPALLVTFLYGLLAVFGFSTARDEVLGAGTAGITWVLVTAVAVLISATVLGAVTHTLARQFGGDGNWAPTIGLAMLVTSITDAPRLLFAIILGGGNGFVQLLGWLTWLGCAALLTSMVSASHDLPWPKALGASAIQLVALLVLFKLPTL